jgi:hypothetical protein
VTSVVEIDAFLTTALAIDFAVYLMQEVAFYGQFMNSTRYIELSFFSR